MPPILLVLAAICSVQLGAAVGKGLFDEIGPGGTVFLRAVFAALLLMVVWRPGLRGHPRRSLWLVLAFGLVLAGMNISFYSAIDRIPLGVAVTFEFVGPLGVAVAGSRRGLDLVWVGLAALGIILLSDFGRGGLDTLGVALALTSGACWAAYIVLIARMGREFAGGQGLALAMLVSAFVLLPVGVAEGGGDLLTPWVLAVAFGAAMLSLAIPNTLELEALRRLPTGVFGVLMSLEPGVAALVGFALLGQDLSTQEVVAILLVVTASAGASRGAALAPRDA